MTLKFKLILITQTLLIFNLTFNQISIFIIKSYLMLLFAPFLVIVTGSHPTLFPAASGGHTSAGSNDVCEQFSQCTFMMCVLSCSFPLPFPLPFSSRTLLTCTHIPLGGKCVMSSIDGAALGGWSDNCQWCSTLNKCVSPANVPKGGCGPKECIRAPEGGEDSHCDQTAGWPGVTCDGFVPPPPPPPYSKKIWNSTACSCADYVSAVHVVCVCVCVCECVCCLEAKKNPINLIICSGHEAVPATARPQLK